MIPAIGLLVGIVLGLLLQPTVPVWLQPYLPIAVVAALDAVFGAFRSVLDGLFNDRIFVISFLGIALSTTQSQTSANWRRGTLSTKAHTQSAAQWHPSCYHCFVRSSWIHIDRSNS